MKRSILVVDDDPNMRSFLLEVLNKLGFEVNTASDGAEAIEKLKQHRYQLIITDLSMPGVNGYELIKWIRENNSMVPIIVMSGEGEIDKADSYDLMKFIKKPFTLTELNSIINSFFKD